MSRKTSQTPWDRVWRDKNGNVVLAQWPNVWLVGWAVLTFVSLFFRGMPADALTAMAAVLLIVWAVLEVASGVNYFRRALGAVVFVFAVSALIHSL